MKNIYKWVSIVLLLTFQNIVGYSQCDTPTGQMTANITTTSADVSWTAVAGADHYRVRHRIGNESWTYSTSGTNSFSLLGLNSSTNYRWEVRTFCTANELVKSDWSSSLFFQTLGAGGCDTPTNPMSANLTVSTVDLSWDSEPNALFYRIRYKDGNFWTYIDEPTTSVNLTNLNVNSTYRWQVRAVCSADEVSKSQWSGNQYFTTNQCLNTVSNLVSSNVMDDEATLDWDAVAGDGYEIALTVQGSQVWDTIFVATNSYNPTGLYTGTDYRWEVAVVCDLSNDIVSPFTISTPSDNHEFTTTGSPACPPPIGLNNGTPGNTTVGLSWTSEGAAFGYDVQYRVVGAKNWIEIPNSDTDITLTDLYTGMPYEARVRSVCTANHSLVGRFSAKIKFNTTGPIQCETPTNMSTTGIGNNQATTNWDDVSGGLVYNVRYRPDNSNQWITVGSDDNSELLSSLSSGVQYRWQVRAICAADTSLISVSSDFTFFTTSGVSSCDTPTNLSTDATTGSTADLSWQAVVGAVSYSIRYKNGNNNWNYVTSGTASTQLSELSTGVLYDWQVKAVCSGDGLLQSDWSSNSTFTTTGATACENPTGLNVTSITASQVTANWTESLTANRGYSVRFKPSGGTYTYLTTTASSSDNSILLPGLTASTSYVWGVRSLCATTLESDWIHSTFVTSDPPLARKAKNNSQEKSHQERIVEKKPLDFNFVPDNTNLNIEVETRDNPFDLEVYDFSGQLLYQSKGNLNKTVIINKELLNSNRLIIVRIISETGISAKKYLLD
ncbi:MAG TPA: fibronectin type III domain-containing protein [Fulvivirga sp.]|nr:fibronectin type III domain-containing protein [Fulvivirga sp.]